MSTRNLPMCHGRYSVVNTCALWNELTKYYEDQLAAEEAETDGTTTTAMENNTADQHVVEEVAADLSEPTSDAATSHQSSKKSFLAGLNLKVDVNTSPTPVSSPSIESNFMTYLPCIAEETDEEADLDDESSPAQIESQSDDNTQSEDEDGEGVVFSSLDTLSPRDQADVVASAGLNATPTDVPCYVDIPVYLNRHQHADDTTKNQSSITISIPYIEPKYTQVSSMSRYRSPSPFSLDDPRPYHHQQSDQYQSSNMEHQQSLYASMVKNTRSADSYNLHSIWHAFSQIIFFLQLLHPSKETMHLNHDHEPDYDDHPSTTHKDGVTQPSTQVDEPIPKDTPSSELFKDVIETVHTLEHSSEEVSITLFVSVLQQVFHLLHVDLKRATHTQLPEDKSSEVGDEKLDSSEQVDVIDGLKNHEGQIINKNKQLPFMCTFPSI